MNTIIKNNKKLLRKRNKLKHRLGGYDSNKNTEYNVPKANPKQLLDLKRRLQKENKKEQFLTIVIIVILTAILISALVTIMHSNK